MHQGTHVCVPMPDTRSKKKFLGGVINVGYIRNSPKNIQIDILAQHLEYGDIDKAYEVVKMIDDRNLIEKMRYTGDINDT